VNKNKNIIFSRLFRQISLETKKSPPKDPTPHSLTPRGSVLETHRSSARCSIGTFTHTNKRSHTTCVNIVYKYITIYQQPTHYTIYNLILYSPL